MPDVLDFLEIETLRQLQDDFCAVSGLPLRICHPDGTSVTNPGETPESFPPSGEGDLPATHPSDPLHSCVPIHVEDELVGCSCIPAGGQIPALAGAHAYEFLTLLSRTVAQLCEQRSVVRSRVVELAAVHRITAEFTGQRDLQALLDLVTNTVVQTFGAKASTIRLLNEDRTELMIRSASGFSPEYLRKGPILVEVSPIDREVIEAQKSVYIDDVRNDPRVLYPAEARREGLVSGLCAPLIFKGRTEGVIRVYMAEEHEFDWFEVSLLQTLAGAAAAAIINARLYAEADHGRMVERQLRLAGEVQRRMIPSKLPSVPGLEIAAVYEPCFELGGDFFDVIELPEDNWGIAICDVVGKGVRASLLMASIRASLRAHATEVYSMSEVLEKVNRVLCADTLSSDFATLFYGVYDNRQRRLTYANAGHPAPILWRGERFCHLSTGGGIIGVEETSQWRHDSMICRTGDVIVAYTDGLSESLNFEDESFGIERLRGAITTAIHAGYDADGIARHLMWELRRFTGLQTRYDDLTIVVMRVQ